MKFLVSVLCILTLEAADPPLYLKELSQIRNLLDKEDFLGALGEAKLLNKKAPDEIIGYQLMAAAELALGRYGAAEKSIQWMLDLKLGKTGSSGWMLVARFREATGDVDGALEAVNQSFLRLAQGEDADARGLLTYSARLQLLAGKLSRAEAAALEAMKISAPGDTLAVETLARVRVAQNRPEEAVTALRVLPSLTSNPRLLYLLAEASGAPADYSAFEKAAPGKANRELALYLAGKGGNPAKAVQVARKLAERKGDVHTNDALAVALFANGEVEEARKLMKTVLAVGTQDPEILAHAAKMGVKAD